MADNHSCFLGPFHYFGPFEPGSNYSISGMRAQSVRMARRACIFCDIINKSKESRILYEDAEFLAFPDIKPAAEHHYLVVTRRHIKDAKELTKDDIPLLQRMIDQGYKILQENGADMGDTRFGFHWPPFHSVSHLHMHAISPASSMSYVSRLIFKPNTLWFVQPEYVMERLKRA